MKNRNNIIFILFFIPTVMIISLPVITEAEFKMPFGGHFYPSTTDNLNGKVDLILEIEAGLTCSNVKVTVTEKKNLTTTQNEWLIAVEDNKTSKLTIPIQFTENDTSIIKLFIEGCNATGRAEQYIISNDGTEKFYMGNPAYIFSIPDYDTIPRKRIGISDEELTKQKYLDPNKTYIYISPGNFVEVDPDTIKPVVSEWTHEITLDSLHVLEQTPLTKYNKEIYVIDGVTYTRDRGEYTFSISPPGQDIREKILAKVKENEKKNPVYDLNIDLSDPDKFDLVKSLADTVILLEEPSIYHIKIKKKNIRILEDNNIRYKMYPAVPGKNQPLPTPSKKK